MYTIKIKYQTSNSFSSYEEEELLEWHWQHIDKAREALQSIDQHYKAYQQHEDGTLAHDTAYHKMVKPKQWHKQCDFDNAKQYREYWKSSLAFQLDNGKWVQQHVFWTGYFERLLCAEVVLDSRLNRIEF